MIKNQYYEFYTPKLPHHTALSLVHQKKNKTYIKMLAP